MAFDLFRTKFSEELIKRIKEIWKILDDPSLTEEEKKYYNQLLRAVNKASADELTNALLPENIGKYVKKSEKREREVEEFFQKYPELLPKKKWYKRKPIEERSNHINYWKLITWIIFFGGLFIAFLSILSIFRPP